MKQLEIIFRIWNYKLKRMTFGPRDDEENASWVLAVAQANKIRPMQYIGIEDINKKKIFENDIIKYNYYPNITYIDEDYCSGIYIIDDIRDCMRIIIGEIFNLEVIGNKYENPKIVKDLHKGLYKKYINVSKRRKSNG